MNRILRGDVLSFCRHYRGPLFHGVLCDPPYGLSFMGKDWDHGVPGVPYWEAIRSLCRPGAWLLAFGGTKTHHRLMVAIEDAGWELRDCLMYVFGSGFPKSHDISKAIDKAAGAEREVVGKGESWNRPANKTAARLNVSPGEYNITAPATEAAKRWSQHQTALKPAYEPVILAMNPRDGTFANNALEHGCGGLWVDGCRVAYAGSDDKERALSGDAFKRKDTSDKKGWARPWMDDPKVVARVNAEAKARAQKGRWPANLILDDSEQVRGLFPKTKGGTWNRTKGARHFNNNGEPTGYETSQQDASEGSAARFFYCAKASKSERNAGCEGMAKKAQGCYGEFAGDGRGRQTEHQPTSNHHPTVKPLTLTEYLARLILPPEQDEPRRIFCPFAGSGSEAIGAMQAGWDEVIGVELEREYVEIAKARLAHWMEEEEELPLLAGS